MDPRNSGMLQRLVLCTCGHALDDHLRGSCRGDRSKACTCDKTPELALDAAIAHARNESFLFWDAQERALVTD